MSQLDLFRETPEPKREAPLTPPRPYDPLDSLLVILLDGPDAADAKEDAKYIVENHPDATAEQLLAVINEAEVILARWRCAPLTALRAELERIHPAWR